MTRLGRSGQRLGVPYVTVPAPGISEDVALLLAYEKGAELIVAVGTHFNLIEFLERDREGMSSTFMTRLRVGEILVDAKGVSELVSPRVGVWPLVAFAGAGVAAIAVAIAASPDLRIFIQVIGQRPRHRRPRLIGDLAIPSTAALGLADAPRCSQPPPPLRAYLAERAHGRRDRANSATRADRAMRAEASHEVLASREDVWRFLAEPYHLADWWPTVSAVHPDARGFPEGARWDVVGPTSPTLFRKGGATGLPS